MSGTVSRGQEAGRPEVAAVTAQQTGPRRRRAVVTVAGDQVFAEKVLRAAEEEASSMLAESLAGVSVDWL